MKTFLIAIVILSASCRIKPPSKPPVKPLSDQTKAEKLKSFLHGSDKGSASFQIAVQEKMDRITEQKEGRDPNATDIDEILRKAEKIVNKKE